MQVRCSVNLTFFDFVININIVLQLRMDLVSWRHLRSRMKLSERHSRAC